MMQPPPATVQVSLDGIGIVPPARNLARSPEMAVTVGSASVWATPACSKAVSCAVSFSPAMFQPIVALLGRPPLTPNGLPIETLGTPEPNPPIALGPKPE